MCLHSVLHQLFPVPTLHEEQQPSHSLGQSAEKCGAQRSENFRNLTYTKVICEYWMRYYGLH